MDSSLKFAVFSTKNDLWFAKICVASIRYYYPDNTIYFVKDELLGEFDIGELINFWDVVELSYDTNKFGISGAKMFFYCDEILDDDYCLVLDADIILIGRLTEPSSNSDIGISIESEEDPCTNRIRDLYFDVNEPLLQPYVYPGYFFNAGQIFCRRGGLNSHKAELSRYFDFCNYPRWKRLDILPKHDQALLNYYFSKLDVASDLNICKMDFMIWTGWERSKEFSLVDVMSGKLPFLLHYAGEKRNRYLKNLKRSDLLQFFNNYYYSKIPYGIVINGFNTFRFGLKYFFGVKVLDALRLLRIFLFS